LYDIFATLHVLQIAQYFTSVSAVSCPPPPTTTFFLDHVSRHPQNRLRPGSFKLALERVLKERERERERDREIERETLGPDDFLTLLRCKNQKYTIPGT
jgi:hypothetical protein